MDTNSVFINSSKIGGTILPQNFDSLLEAAKAGENQALSEIYEQYFGKIYKFIYYRTGHQETAEDLTEDVFVKAFEKLAGLKEAKAFEGWLFQIARNKIIDHYRSRQTVVNLEELENTLEYETNIIDNANLQIEQRTLLKLIKELPSDQQVVIKLRFYEQFSHLEIANLLQKNEGTIRVLQHRALNSLKELYQDFISAHGKK